MYTSFSDEVWSLLLSRFPYSATREVSWLIFLPPLHPCVDSPELTTRTLSSSLFVSRFGFSRMFHPFPQASGGPPRYIPLFLSFPPLRLISSGAFRTFHSLRQNAKDPWHFFFFRFPSPGYFAVFFFSLSLALHSFPPIISSRSPFSTSPSP